MHRVPVDMISYQLLIACYFEFVFVLNQLDWYAKVHIMADQVAS